MTTVLTLTAKNQLTLPVEMLQYLGIDRGNKLWTRIEAKKIVIEKVEDSWDDLQGSLQDTKLTKGKSVLEIIKLAKKLEAKRLARKNGLQIR